MNKPKLSVVLGTFNRFDLIPTCIEHIRQSVGNLSYEIIVVDGGSTDGTREWLASQQDILLLGERSLEGACAAFNKAFSLARAEYVAHINDDAYCLGNCLEKAVIKLDENKLIGQVSIPIRWSTEEYRVDYAEGILYCNMGITRKWLGDLVGWWSDYRTYYGDIDLSFKIRRCGYEIVELKGERINHLEHIDELRINNTQKSDADLFYSRWKSYKFPQKPKFFEKDIECKLPWVNDIGMRFRPKFGFFQKVLRKINHASGNR